MRSCEIKQAKNYIPRFRGREETFHCEKQGDVQVMHLVGSADPLECPLCIQEREEQEKREKFEEQRIKKLTAMGIRDRHFNASFANYEPENKDAKQYLHDLYELARNPRDTIVLMYGNCGTGKSHLASAAVILNNAECTT